MDYKAMMDIINQNIDLMLPELVDDETLVVTVALVNGQALFLSRALTAPVPGYVILRGYIRNDQGQFERASALLPEADIRLVVITAAKGLKSPEKEKMGFKVDR